MSRTLEQKRAFFALQFIKQVNPEDAVKISTLIKNAPIQVLQNGLGQMLAYLLADNEGKTDKERKPSGTLYLEFQKWLCGPKEQNHPCRVYLEKTQLIEQLVSGDRAQYMRAQQETLALSNWLKKFADAWLEKETP